MMDANNSALKNIIILIKPYKIHIFSSFIISLFITFISIFIPKLSELLIDEGLINNKFIVVVHMSLAIIFINILNQTLIIIQKMIHQNIQISMQYKMSSEAFSHLLKLKMCYFEQNSSFSLLTSVNMSINEMCEVANTKFLNIGLEIVKMFGGVIGLSLLDIRLTLFVILSVVLRFIGLRLLKTKRTGIFEKLLDLNMKFSAWFSDTLNGIRIVKLWNIDKNYSFRKLTRDQINAEKKYNRLYMVEDYISNVIDTILTYSLYIIGAFLILHNSLSIGSLFAFIMYTGLVVDPLFSLVQLDYQLSKIKPAINTYMDFISLEEEQPFLDNKSAKYLPVIHKISFDAVSWEFDGQSIISDISFEIKRNEKVALIGSNGSGKSTIIDLLLKFRKPTSGNIRINDIEINEFDLNEYRKMFSVIDQDCFLFNSTIKENLLIEESDNISRFDNNTSNPIYHWLINQISDFSKGLDTPTGHNGTLLSGGEKQKIVLLRSLLKSEAKILILDEATSNYDISSEKTFNDFVLNTESYDCILVVSHRPEVLKSVDRILIIENGKIIANGTYDDLNKLNLLQKFII